VHNTIFAFYALIQYNTLIMQRKLIIIWMTSLIYAGQGVLSSAVICYEADGQIKIESSHHNHCHCPQNYISETVDSSGLYLIHSHNHCSDLPLSLTSTTLIVKTKTQTDTNSHIVYSVEIYQEQILSARFLPPYISIFEQYFSPLNTIILQA